MMMEIYSFANDYTEYLVSLLRPYQIDYLYSLVRKWGIKIVIYEATKTRRKIDQIHTLMQLDIAVTERIQKHSSEEVFACQILYLIWAMEVSLRLHPEVISYSGYPGRKLAELLWKCPDLSSLDSSSICYWPFEGMKNPFLNRAKNQVNLYWPDREV